MRLPVLAIHTILDLALLHRVLLWNSQNDQKFAVSQTLLLKVTGCNLVAIKRILEEQADSIEQHHSQFGIQPRHQSKKLHLILDFLELQQIPNEVKP